MYSCSMISIKILVPIKCIRGIRLTKKIISSGYSNSTTGQYSGPSHNRYSPQHGQYNTPQRQYNNSNSSSYNRNYYGKRKPEMDNDGKKSGRKKKKSLSKNVPQRKDWSVDDARRALLIEKDYNKKNKNLSLIIKFPDLELNRDIVSKFSPAIESVHFQQPSTPRFCFVTLKDSADPERIINQLNRTQFGQGFLSAEYKKDREDEINIGPEDIDPLTLYVGNLAQEVTKDDMVNTYPKQKRIDIGYAKKMKYTRYAFVSFKSVDDCIEAFRKTHATQMYSKSLIVRFRRLNGTVGMPGEPKPQAAQRNEPNDPQNSSSVRNTNNDHNFESRNSTDVERYHSLAPWEKVDVSNWETHLQSVKEEPPGESEEEEEFEEIDIKPPVPSYVSPFLPGSLDQAFGFHRPKVEIKNEKDDLNYLIQTAVIPSHNDAPNSPKENEPERKPFVNNVDGDCRIVSSDEIKKELGNSGLNTYESLRLLNRKNKNVNFMPIIVKREVSTPTMDEISTNSGERISKADLDVSLRVKNEPADEDDETNDGDDDSSDSDDFNFSSVLNSIEARKKRVFKKPVPEVV